MIARTNLVLLLLVLMVPSPATASEDLDVTMRMVDEHEDITDSVTREIRLPELPGLRQGENRPRVENAPGRPLRERARERSAAFGQSVSEQARESRPDRSETPGQARPPGERPERLPQSARP